MFFSLLIHFWIFTHSHMSIIHDKIIFLSLSLLQDPESVRPGMDLIASVQILMDLANYNCNVNITTAIANMKAIVSFLRELHEIRCSVRRWQGYYYNMPLLQVKVRTIKKNHIIMTTTKNWIRRFRVEWKKEFVWLRKKSRYNIVHVLSSYA